MYKLFLLACVFVAVQADGKAKYKFELEVHDHHGGGVQTRKEERNGDTTSGEYTIAGKDGSKTKVQYSVYGHHGHEHHEEHHNGHHYSGAQYNSEPSGYQGYKAEGLSSSGYKGAEGLGSSGYKTAEGLSSSSYKAAGGFSSSGYKASEGLRSSSYQSGHLSSSQSHGYNSGSAGYHLGQGSSSEGSQGYSHSSLSLGSLGHESKLGYGSQIGNGYESHSNIGGSGGYKLGQALSSVGSSGFQQSGHGSAELGHYSAGSQSLFGYKLGHGSEQKYSQGSSGYHGRQEIKLSQGPLYHGFGGENKLEVSYKKPQTIYYKDQKSSLNYESGFHPISSNVYKSESQSKYGQYQAHSGAEEAKGYSSGGYRASGQAKSYHNFITYESGKGDQKHYHQPSYNHGASQQNAYTSSQSNKGSYGSVISHVQPAYQSYHQESQAGGYKVEAAGNLGGYQSKYSAPLVIQKPVVHEISEFESTAYDSGKGGYHYYGASENNNGHKSSFSNYHKLPEISSYGSKGGYGASLGGYSSSQVGYGKAHGGLSLSHGASYGASQLGYGASSQEGYGLSKGSYSSSQLGYGSSKGSYSSSHLGYGSSKNYGSSQEGSEHSRGYGSLESSKGYSSSLGNLESLKGYGSSGESRELSKGYGSSEGYSSKGGYSSEYSSGEAATSTLKLHTHGAHVEQIVKHIIPPKYHDGKY